VKIAVRLSRNFTNKKVNEVQLVITLIQEDTIKPAVSRLFLNYYFLSCLELKLVAKFLLISDAFSSVCTCLNQVLWVGVDLIVKCFTTSLVPYFIYSNWRVLPKLRLDVTKTNIGPYRVLITYNRNPFLLKQVPHRRFTKSAMFCVEGEKNVWLVKWAE